MWGSEIQVEEHWPFQTGFALSVDRSEDSFVLDDLEPLRLQSLSWCGGRGVTTRPVRGGGIRRLGCLTPW